MTTDIILRMNIRLPALFSLVVILVSGCATPPQPKAMVHNWDLNEIERVIYSAPELMNSPRAMPLRVIEIMDSNTLTVTIGDYGFLSGGGVRLTMKFKSTGQWEITDITPFDS